MRHIKLFEAYARDIQKDKGYLGDGIGIMYHPELHVMYIGSDKDSKTNYTIKDVYLEDEVMQIKDILKDMDPKLWKTNLVKAGYEVSDGGEYFDITRDK